MRQEHEKLLRLLTRLLKKAPKLALKFVLTLLSPRAHLKRLALVCVLQLLASLVHFSRKVWRRGILFKNQALLRQQNATTYEDYLIATREVDYQKPAEADVSLPEDQASYFQLLLERAANYRELQAAGDEYGLMFHLRSELMRQQLGNRGYSREGCATPATCAALQNIR